MQLSTTIGTERLATEDLTTPSPYDTCRILTHVARLAQIIFPSGGVISSLYEGQLVTLAPVVVEDLTRTFDNESPLTHCRAEQLIFTDPCNPHCSLPWFRLGV